MFYGYLCILVTCMLLFQTILDIIKHYDFLQEDVVLGILTIIC